MLDMENLDFSIQFVRDQIHLSASDFVDNTISPSSNNEPSDITVQDAHNNTAEMTPTNFFIIPLVFVIIDYGLL